MEPPYLDTHADYRDWKILHTFKSIDDCEAGEQRAETDAANGTLTAFDGGFVGLIGEGDDYTGPQPWLDQQTEAECMPADDPRIKGIKSE